MSNFLSVLLGGAGAGLSDYGRNTMQDEERKRAAQQRMDEIAANSKALTERQSADDARTFARDQAARKAKVAGLKLVMPDAPDLPDDVDPSTAIPLLLDKQRTAEAAKVRSATNQRIHQALVASGRKGIDPTYNDAVDYKELLGLNKQDDGQQATIDALIKRRDLGPMPSSTPNATNDRVAYITQHMGERTKGRTDPITRRELPGLAPDSAAKLLGTEWDAAHGKSTAPAAAPAAPMAKVITPAIRAEMDRDPKVKAWYLSHGYR